jgi:hypothetical protein
MKTYDIEVTDIYKYSFPIEANSKQEALVKAKMYYESEDSEDGVTGVADANSHAETKFKIKQNK